MFLWLHGFLAIFSIPTSYAVHLLGIFSVLIPEYMVNLIAARGLLICCTLGSAFF